MPNDILQALGNTLGFQNILFDEKQLADELKNTLGVNRQVQAMAYPSSTDQVVQIVDIANHFKVPIYPVSRGRNIGYGDKTPISDHNIVVDLKKMNMIKDFDKSLGNIRLEPGVTQKQLYTFLMENNAPFWMDATGSGYDSSIVGNALDGGFGHTPKGNKRDTISDLEIVCGNGKILRTGTLQGFGPDLRGLFVQSNFGVVTSLKTELTPVPEQYASFVLKVFEDRHFEALIDGIRKLRQNGTLSSLVHIANATRSLMTTRDFPEGYRDVLVSCDDAVKMMSSPILKFARWTAIGGLYGTKKEVKAKKAAVKEKIKGIGKIDFFSDDKINRLGFLKRFGKNLAESVESLDYIHGLGKGVPNDKQVQNIKWRVENPEDMGLIFFAPNVPAQGDRVKEMISLASGLYEECGFEFPITITFIRPDQVAGLMSICFDKHDEHERTRAFDLYNRLKDAFGEKGIHPYRHNVAAMENIRYDHGKHEVLKALKKAFDPNNIISPGRYGI